MAHQASQARYLGYKRRSNIPGSGIYVPKAVIGRQVTTICHVEHQSYPYSSLNNLDLTKYRMTGKSSFPSTKHERKWQL
jgi:hypothetical protein